MRALALIAAVGCAGVPIHVRADQIERSAAELRRTGSATVPEESGDVDVGPPDEATLHLDDPVKLANVDLTIRSLLKECPDGPITVDDQLRQQYPRCLLFSNADVQVGVKRHVEWGNVAVGAGAVAAAGLVYCTAECKSPYSTISGGVLIGAAVLTVVGVIEIIRIVNHSD